MRILLAVMLSLTIAAVTSCSDDSARRADSTGTEQSPAEATDSTLPIDDEDGEKEHETQPAPEEIGEDCVAFVRSTFTAIPSPAGADCPQCATDQYEVLKFEDFHIDQITPAGPNIQVHVTVEVSFNSSSRAEIQGGLVGKIPAEQRVAYLSGEIPTGRQVIPLTITYRQVRGHWRALEFE